MNARLNELMASWTLEPGTDVAARVSAWLESLQAAGLLHHTTNAILLGEQYHLGGEEDTRRMAQALNLTAADRVVDLACYVGGPARQLARDYRCRVLGVDISAEHIAIAEKLTELSRLADKLRFLCASADSVPEPDASFTVAWCQGSFPPDLAWLPEIRRLLAPGGRLGFTALIHRSPASDPALLSLEETVERVDSSGFTVVSAEDMSDMDLEHGWLPARRRLEDNESHYRQLFGDEWVRKAYAELDTDIESWRTGREGNGRVVAVRP